MTRQFSLFLLGLFILVSLTAVGYGDTSLSDSYDFSSFLMGSEKQPAMPKASEMVTEVSPPYGCQFDGCELSGCGEVCCEEMCCDDACCYDGCCYDECGCGCMCCGSACPCLGCSCYRWRAYAGALFWSRTSPGGGAMVTSNGTTLLDSNDYGFGWNNGWEAGLGRRLNCLWGVEGRFYRVDSFDATHPGVAVSSSDQIQFGTPVSIFASGTMGSWYSSELTNFELNLRRAVTYRMDLVFGFRYLQLNDRYFLGLEDTVTQTSSMRAFNNMYGFHFGPDICLICRERFCLDWGARFGIYGNRIQSGLSYERGGEVGVTYEGSTAQDHTSFSADMTLAGTYRYREGIMVRFGYQVLWLEGVAEATSQMACYSVPNGDPTGIDTDGSPFYHGAFVDLVLTW